MRPLRFWIAAVAIALVAGAITALWPDGIDRPPAAPPPIAPLPAPAADPGAAPALPAPDRKPASRDSMPSTASPPPREATPAPDPIGEPSRDFVREVLRNAFTDKLPDRRLREEEYDRLADAILRMRAARKKMADLPLSEENAAELARLREELTAAAADFEYISELTPSDFTALVDPDLQPIREPVADGENPRKEEEVIFEYLHDTPPR